jgi:hypothetical protein
MDQMRISTDYVPSVMIRKKKLEICNIVKSREKKMIETKHNVMKWNQICWRIELCMR